MGRKREYDREGMDAAVRVLINSGELTNPIEGIPFIYDVTPWFETKDNGRTDETTAAEFYDMAEGDKCFGTYVEAEDSYKTERGFVTGLLESGYVENTNIASAKSFTGERNTGYDGHYYLWAAEGADGTMYNKEQIVHEMVADERNVRLGGQEIEKSDFYVRELTSDEYAINRTEFEIADSSDRKATQHLADEVLASASYLEYLPADDPLRIQGEAAVHAAQNYEDSKYTTTELKNWVYHKAGDPIYQKVPFSLSVEFEQVGVYEKDEKIPKYRTVERSSLSIQETKEMNAGARAYLTAANEQDLVGTAHEAITAGIVNENAAFEYSLKIPEAVNWAIDDAQPYALVNEIGDMSYEQKSEIRDDYVLPAVQGYAQNFMDRIDYVVPNGEKPDDTTLPGYDAYAEKKAEYVEKQTDEIVHSTIREANKEVTGSRDAVTERVQEYMYSKDTTGMSYGEIMRDPAFIAMSQDIQHEIRNSTQQEIDTVNAGLAEIVKLSNPDATPEQITALVGSEFGGLNYEQRILINGTTLSGKVSEAVANGIVEGKTYTEIKRDVKDVYAKAQYATGRLITTEAARAETRSLEEQLKAEGVEEVEVIAESDACEECLALTGKTYSIDDAPEIPVHPNCRCVIRAIVKK